MPRFVLVYHGGKQSMAAEEAARNKERYMEWMRQVGAALVSPANPFGPSKKISAHGVEDVPAEEALSGYSVLEVENLEAAVDIAQSCPFLEIGTLEVAQLLEMRSSQRP